MSRKSALKKLSLMFDQNRGECLPLCVPFAVEGLLPRSSQLKARVMTQFVHNNNGVHPDELIMPLQREEATLCQLPRLPRDPNFLNREGIHGFLVTGVVPDEKILVPHAIGVKPDLRTIDTVAVVDASFQMHGTAVPWRTIVNWHKQAIRTDPDYGFGVWVVGISSAVDKLQRQLPGLAKRPSLWENLK